MHKSLKYDAEQDLLLRKNRKLCLRAINVPWIDRNPPINRTYCFDRETSFRPIVKTLRL